MFFWYLGGLAANPKNKDCIGTYSIGEIKSLKKLFLQFLGMTIKEIDAF